MQRFSSISEVLKIVISGRWRCLWLGFACVLSWIFLVFYSMGSTIYFASNGLDHLDVHAAMNAGVVLVAILLYAYSRKCGQDNFAEGLLPDIAAIVACIATFLLLSFAIYMPVEALSYVFATIAGLGYGYLFVVWGSLIGRNDPPVVLVLSGLSILLASIIDTLVSLLDFWFVMVIAAILPILSLLLMKGYTSIEPSLYSQPEPSPDSLPHPNRVPLRIVLPIMIAGLSYGLMQRLVTTAPVASNFITVATFFIGSLLLILTGHFFLGRPFNQSVLSVTFAFTAVGFILLPLIQNLPNGYTLTEFFYLLGYVYFYYLTWSMCGQVARVFDVTVLQAFAGISAILSGCECIAVLAGKYVVSIIPSSYSFVISLFAIYGFMVTALFSFPYLAKTMNADTAANTTGAEFDTAVKVISIQFGLSEREQEIFYLLAQGRNSSSISKSLYISNDTVRTHMKSIYRKLDIHSQQELIDKVTSVEGHD